MDRRRLCPSVLRGMPASQVPAAGTRRGGRPVRSFPSAPGPAPLCDSLAEGHGRLPRRIPVLLIAPPRDRRSHARGSVLGARAEICSLFHAFCLFSRPYSLYPTTRLVDRVGGTVVP